LRRGGSGILLWKIKYTSHSFSLGLLHLSGVAKNVNRKKCPRQQKGKLPDGMVWVWGWVVSGAALLDESLEGQPGTGSGKCRLPMRSGYLKSYPIPSEAAILRNILRS
jgi:hypothetical protein